MTTTPASTGAMDHLDQRGAKAAGLETSGGGTLRVHRLVQGDGRVDGDLVLRSSTRLAAREFSAEAGINRYAEARGYDLDLSLRQVGILPISHRPQNLVVQQPGRVVFDAQVAAELQRGDPSLGLADQIEGQKPGGQWQFGGLHDRAGRESGLMAAVATLIALEPAAIDQPMHRAIAAGTAVPIGPARLLQCSLTLLLGAVEPLERRQVDTFLKLDRAASHGQTSICVPLYAPRAAITV